MQQNAAATAAEQPMEQVQKLLCSMLEGLKADPFVPEEQIKCATVHVQQLVQGFATTLEESRRAQRVQADAAKGGPTTRRDGKQPLVTPSAATVSSVRHAGKQGPKRLISDHFKVVKTIVKAPRVGAAPADGAEEVAEAHEEEMDV